MTQDGIGKQPPANEISQRYKICIAYSLVEDRTKAKRERNSRKDHRLRPFPYPLPRESPLAGTMLRGKRRASRTVQISDKNPTTPEAKVGLLKRRGNKITSGSGAKKGCCEGGRCRGRCSLQQQRQVELFASVMTHV